MTEDKTKNNVVTLEPPEAEVWQGESKQLDMWAMFYSNDKDSCSNTIEFWDSIPKYVLNSQQQAKRRTKEGFAAPYEYQYTKNGSLYKVMVQAALIKQKDGSFKAFFPSSSEEVIEEVLKRIMTDQKFAVHESKEMETWVRFSLRMIHQELKEIGKSKSIVQIRQSLQIMSGSIITIYKDDAEMWKGAILQDLVTVNRSQYFEDTTSHHIARLPLFISHALNELDYRQFNYKKLMKGKNQLTRYLHKRIIHKYTYASFVNSHHFLYSTIKEESGLLEQGEEKTNRNKLKQALIELTELNIICRVSVKPKKEGRKVVDVIYEFYATSDFTKEQKAANGRNQELKKLDLEDKY